jgi:restriction system protein
MFSLFKKKSKKNINSAVKKEPEKKLEPEKKTKPLRKLSWGKISKKSDKIQNCIDYVNSLYYDGYVTNAPYEDEYWQSSWDEEKPEHVYQKNPSSVSTKDNLYIKESEKWYRNENSQIYTYDNFSLSSFELLPQEKLGSIDIPPFPKFEKNVSDIVYKDPSDEEYSFLERLNEVHQEALELYDQKYSQFQITKDEIDSKWSKLNSNLLSNSEDNLLIEEYLSYILKRHLLPYFFNNDYKVKLDILASTLIIQFNFPDFGGHKFVTGQYQSSSYFDPKYKYASNANSKKIIENSLYSLIIRSAFICSKYLPDNHGKIIVVNAEQNWFDPSTGKPKSGIIASVQGEKSFFSSLDTKKLNPKECFKSLKGLSTKSLQNVSPIRPVMSLDTDDSRLVEGKNLNLDQGTNLAAMPWEDFEHLVAQIFELEFSKSGVEVKVTQVSRDRGVDAILFDPDPLKGGKYILQAKRYTRTVDVSSVRDLYGTVMNEGANRGILITTSSYGPDAYEFAKDKPITLIDGPNLLSLFEKHQMKYRIDIDEARSLNLDNED